MDESNPDWNELLTLARRIIVNGDDTWEPFWERLRPLLDTWLRQPRFLGRISQNEDHVRDISLITWEKLQERDYAKLRAFFNSTSGQPATTGDDATRFRAWMFRVVKNIGIDYMRKLPEYIRRPTPGDDNDSGMHWLTPVSYDSGIKANRPQITVNATARRALEYLDETIPERMRQVVALYGDNVPLPDIAKELGLGSIGDAERLVARSRDRVMYRSALELWTQGFTDEEIAEELALGGPEHASRLHNAARQFLRRHLRSN